MMFCQFISYLRRRRIRKFLARAIRENELLANFEKHQVEAMVAEMYSERVAPNTRLIQEDELGTL